jgi:hypothetical protein
VHRGGVGGWRDPWDEPDDSAQLRAQVEAAERRLMDQADGLGQGWRAEILEERRQADRA